MSEPDAAAGGTARYVAQGQSQQYNAHHQTIYHVQQGQVPRPRRPWMAPPLNAAMIARPDVSDPLLDLICTPGAEPVGIVGLHGTGGFGKTTLAVWLCHQPEVKERFPGGLLWVTLGEHTLGAVLAERINDLVEHLTGRRPAFTSAQQAGFGLAEALDNLPEPTLLIIDDVWREEQLSPLQGGGPQCRRVVTTRQRWLIAPETSVGVDRMQPSQSAALLMRGVGEPVPELAERILAATGRWPVLLNLANRALLRSVRYGASADLAMHDIAERLADDGPVAFDVDNPEHREHAVAATVRAGLDLLPSAVAERFSELVIFGEDIAIPLNVLERLWGATAGLSSRKVRQTCETLADLSLILEYDPEAGIIRLHDVIRAFLLHTSTPETTRRLHECLLDAAAAGITDSDGLRCWWHLSVSETYIVEHLTEHLAEAGRHTELEALITDLRWLAMRLGRRELAGLESDLTRGRSATSAALAQEIRRNAHLLRPHHPG